MKELSIEQKARAYDEALKKAKSKIKNDKDHVLYEDDVIDIFPELAESEDEKNKRILRSISSKMSLHLRDIFTEEEFQCFDAWFEKQGKKESYASETMNEKGDFDNGFTRMMDKEQKPADNIESSAFKDKLLELFQKFRCIKEGVPTNGDIIDYVDAHIQELIDTVQNKPWSEEDEKEIQHIINFLNHPDLINATPTIANNTINWLKSLKDRVQPQNK